MLCKAQVSLEFLLVVASAFFAMLLIAPSIVVLSTKAINATELAKAKLFVSDLEFVLRKLNVLSEGSEFTLVCEPLTKWAFSINSATVTLTVNKSAFQIESPVRFASDEEFVIDGRTCFHLKREPASVKLLVEDC